MGLIKRKELPDLLAKAPASKVQVYLFFGERYLCRESADQLQEALLAATPGVVHAIDGEQEAHDKIFSQLMNFSLLPGLQIYRVTDSRIFLSKSIAPDIWAKAEQAHQAKKPQAARRHLNNLAAMSDLDGNDSLAGLTGQEWQKVFGFSKPAGDLSWADQLLQESGGKAGGGKKSSANAGSKLIKMMENGLPPNNILILCTDNVDKRQKLFTAIKKLGQAVDCKVDTGAGSAAQRVQKEVLLDLAAKTLAEFGKTIEPAAAGLLIERVGFHPVALVMETEKLALFAGDRPRISRNDVEQMAGRTREDALFELTDAFGKKQTGRMLTILTRLLDSGVHGLVILATLRNYFRKMMLFRSIQYQASPPWFKGMQANHFQNNYLPALKEKGQWTEQLKGHPYALYMSFIKAAEFSMPVLKQYLTLLLQAEYRLKGSPFEQELILQEMMIAMMNSRI
ncbi:MAG: DNA polymerase III subunit delta [Deltaproteobacteria bacterium]|nr:MAG: DNA polymerase III subunit delta [Deltaproteobacteria bacterium]